MAVTVVSDRRGFLPAARILVPIMFGRALLGVRAGRVGYWDPDKGAVVIEDGDGGTVFTPKGGYNWFKNVLK